MTDEHRFVWSGENPDDIHEFTSTIETAVFIYRQLNFRFAGKECNFGFEDGPQFQGVAGSTTAMDAVRSLEEGVMA